VVFSTTRLHHGADVYITSPVPFDSIRPMTLRAYARTGANRSLIQSFVMSRETPAGLAMLALSVRQITELLDITLETTTTAPVTDEKLQLALFAGPLDSYVGKDPTAHRATGAQLGVLNPRETVRDLMGFQAYEGTTELDFLGFDAFNVDAATPYYLNIYDDASAGPYIGTRIRHCYRFGPGESQSVRIPHSKHLDSRLGALRCSVTTLPLGGGVQTNNVIYGTVYVQ
jgi:hypothetical protein